MTIRSGFFNSVNGDRKYKADFFAEYFASFIANGVFPNPSTNLQVISNDDMTISIRAGKAWINGYYFVNDDDYILTIDNADGVLNRIDRIVLQLNYLNREIVPVIKKGTFASSPVAPSLQRDADAYELAIADVYIGAGSISISQANITDTRLNTELCGVVHGLIDQVDTSTIFNQYQAWLQSQIELYEDDLLLWTEEKKQEFEQWKQLRENDFDLWQSQEKQAFDNWFDSVQNILDGNVAGNLLNLIQQNTTEISNVKQTVASHQADDVSQGEVHGLRVTDGKLEYFDGQEWKRVKGDGYPVGNVSNFRAKAGNGEVILTWEDPADVTITDSNNNVITIARWKGTKILRKTGSYPQNENDGVLVVDNGIRNQYAENGFIDTGLTNDVTYYYMALPYTEEDVYTVDEANRVEATPTEQRIYGVRIDKNNSNPETRVTYIGDAIGFTPMRGNNGNFQWGSWKEVFESFEIIPVVLKNKQVQYYLDPNDFTKKADGSTATLTGADGDVMIEFGKPLWWKWEDEGTTYTIEISDKEFDGAVKHAFEIEEGYNLVTYYPLLLTQILFVIFFKSTDSQTALGRGRVDGAGYISTGNTDKKGMFYGSTNDEQMKFLGIEDYWGNKYWWIDGLVTDSNYNLLIGKGSFNDNGSGYQTFASGVSSNTSGYIDSVQGGNDKGFIIKSSNGSETTYYADYGSLSSSRVAQFGGARSVGSSAGFAYLRLFGSASNADAYVGARLFCASNGKIYIGAYLGTSTGGKLRSVSGTSEPTGSKTISTFRDEARANN